MLRDCGVWKAAADLVIDPDVSGFKYDDFERSAELIRSGETAMRAALPEVRKWLAQPELDRKPQSVSINQPATAPAK